MLLGVYPLGYPEIFNLSGKASPSLGERYISENVPQCYRRADTYLTAEPAPPRHPYATK